MHDLGGGDRLYSTSVAPSICQGAPALQQKAHILEYIRQLFEYIHAV